MPFLLFLFSPCFFIFFFSFFLRNNFKLYSVLSSFLFCSSFHYFLIHSERPKTRSVHGRLTFGPVPDSSVFRQRLKSKLKHSDFCVWKRNFNKPKPNVLIRISDMSKIQTKTFRFGMFFKQNHSIFEQLELKSPR